MHTNSEKQHFSLKKYITYFLITQLIVVVAGIIIFEFGLRATGVVWKHVYRSLHDKDNNFYLYAIGGSTTEGEPFMPKISFPKIVAYLYDNKIQNKNIKIINLARGGRNI